MNNTINKDTKEKKLEIFNSSIKVYISHLLVLLNLSTLNFTKPKSMFLPVPTMLDPTKYNFQSSSNQSKLKED